MAEFHLKFWDVCHKPTTSLFVLLLVFSNNSILTFLEGCFPSSVVAEVGIFFSILLCQWFIFYYFFRRRCDVALFTHHLVLSGSCYFHAYPFNQSAVSSLQVLPSYQVLPLFSTWVLSQILLTHYAILSIVPEVVCCWFHQVSSHLLKFMFYSFHVQLECCPNSSSLILF